MNALNSTYAFQKFEATPEIQKLNNRIAAQPQSYREYNHNSNPNTPFGDDDTDESDWDVNSDDDTDAFSSREVCFELVATNSKELEQSLAHLEKQFHVEHGLEGLTLDEDEIAKLKCTNYNKQTTLDKLKTIERQIKETDKALTTTCRIDILPLITEEDPCDSGANEHKLDADAEYESTICTRKSPSQNIDLWRPPLHIIYQDKMLLAALIAYTTTLYNEENILFLQHVDELTSTMWTNGIDDIDSKISFIYNTFINHNAEYQINLSSACLCDIMSKRNTYTASDYDEKRSMFDLCARQIKHLIIGSILPSFYRSPIFQRIAAQSWRRPKTNAHVDTKMRSFAPRTRNGYSVQPCKLAYIQLPVESGRTYGAQLTTPESDHIWNTPMPTRSAIKPYNNRSPSSVASESPLSTSVSIGNSLTEISADCGCSVSAQ
eukprot:93254_1